MVVIEEEKRHQNYVKQSKDLKSGPLAPGVKKDAGEREYIADAADALENPEAGKSGPDE